MHNLKPQYIKLTKEKRLLDSVHPIIGLTGGIATGKTTVSDYLKNKGYPLICADTIVKIVYNEREMKKLLKELTPDAFTEKDQIDFSRLRSLFFNNQEIKAQIEQKLFELYPHILQKEFKKLDFSEHQFFIYDVPLLFEKNLQKSFDCTWLVYSPRNLQLDRLLKRDPNTTVELATKILDSQFPIDDKRKLADFIIENDSSLKYLHSQVDQAIIKYLE